MLSITFSCTHYEATLDLFHDVYLLKESLIPLTGIIHSNFVKARFTWDVLVELLNDRERPTFPERINLHFSTEEEHTIEFICAVEHVLPYCLTPGSGKFSQALRFLATLVASFNHAQYRRDTLTITFEYCR